jgi:HD-GYP domain-containing protein (c-di-GMP phosphodiesterase class II)
MEAAAGRAYPHDPSARRSDPGEEHELLAHVVALACRVIEVEEAVVLLRERARDHLVEIARAGRARPRRGVSARCPLVVDGESRGVLAVLARERLSAGRLELLGEFAELAARALEERNLRERAQTMGSAAVEVLARAVDVRDDYTGRHSAQVGELARRVGERLGMTGDEITLLVCAARLHDVGKLGVPDTILRKPGPLDEAEWAIMRRHPEWGADMVASVPGLEPIGSLVGSHHERWDGCGYPDGLAGEAIPLASRVISVCDAYEAMVSHRPYRAPLSKRRAVAELLGAAGTQFDPQVVAAAKAELRR